MQDALWAATRKSVDAVNAPRRGRGTYICPECMQLVFLARGDWQEPCFRHYANQPKANNCERRLGGTSGSAASHLSRLRVSLVLDVKLGAAQPWSLALRLPPTENTAGIVAVRTSSSTLQEVPLSSLRDGREIAIIADRCAYGIERVGRAASSYGDRFTRASRTVTLNRFSFFRATRNGKATMQQRHVYWSLGYYVLQHGAERAALPESLQPREIGTSTVRADYRKWRCYHVRLPVTVDVSARVWLERVAGLEVLKPRVEAYALYPPVVRTDESDILFMPSDVEHHVIALKQNVEDAEESAFFVAALGEEQAAVPLRDDPWSIAHVRAPLANSTHSDLSVGVDDISEGIDWYPIATLRCAKTESFRRPAAFRLIVANDHEHTEVSFPAQTAAALADVRARRLALRKLATTVPMRVELCTRKSGALTWVVVSYGASDSRLVGDLVAALHVPSLDVRLKVDGLGDVTLLGAPAANSFRAPARKRISAWTAAFAGSRAPNALLRRPRAFEDAIDPERGDRYAIAGEDRAVALALRSATRPKTRRS